MFDEAKSQSNREKHGIDFIEAQAIWSDQNRVDFRARTEREPRYAIIGLIEDKYWTAIVTYRGDTVRLISVRRKILMFHPVI